MKNLLVLILMPTLLLLSCSGDDMELEQTASGKINGLDFEASSSRYDELSDGKLRFEVFNETLGSNDICSFSSSDIRIFFQAENNREKQELFLDFSNFEGFTITLFDPDGAQNIIATDGFFRIISIVNGIADAEMDIKYDNDSYVKGRFQANLCP